jgi:hypothetical protein
MADLYGRGGHLTAQNGNFRPGQSLFALKQHARSQIDLEQAAAVANSRYEIGKSQALGQQELYDTRIAMSKSAAARAQQQLELLNVARKAAEAEVAKQKKEDMIALIRDVSGRVDPYGAELNAVHRKSKAKADVLRADRERAVSDYHATQTAYRSAAQAHGTLELLLWLREYLLEIRRRRSVDRDKEAKFRKVRKVTRAIKLRHNLAGPGGAALFCYTPDRKRREAVERNTRAVATAAAKEDAVAQGVLREATEVADEWRRQMNDNKGQLAKVDYQADRAFRMVKISKKKLDQFEASLGILDPGSLSRV